MLNRVNIISIDFLLIIRKYHYSVLLFNLIPVIPLDGSKVLNVILNIFFSYKKSLNITNYVSILIITLSIASFLIFKYKVEFSYLIILSSILNNIIDTPFLFNKFLFERYKHPTSYLNPFYIKDGNIKNMRRQRKNYFYINNKYVDENIILNERFEKTVQ